MMYYKNCETTQMRKNLFFIGWAVSRFVTGFWVRYGGSVLDCGVHENWVNRD
jgi:hypothetical protein